MGRHQLERVHISKERGNRRDVLEDLNLQAEGHVVVSSSDMWAPPPLLCITGQFLTDSVGQRVVCLGRAPPHNSTLGPLWLRFPLITNMCSVPRWFKWKNIAINSNNSNNNGHNFNFIGYIIIIIKYSNMSGRFQFWNKN